MAPISKTTSIHEAEYNNKLFKNLIDIYDPVASLLAPIRKAVMKSLRLPRHAKILDVACGTGTQAILLALKDDFKVTGIDLSPVMLGRARKKAGKDCHVRFIRGDATRMPFRNRTFDASLISFGLHDMPENLRSSVLEEMKRVTKKDGRIVIVDYATPPVGIIPRAEKIISNLFESKYFDSFIKTGLDHYLEEAHLSQTSKQSLLAGIAQLVICTVT